MFSMIRHNSSYISIGRVFFECYGSSFTMHETYSIYNRKNEDNLLVRSGLMKKSKSESKLGLGIGVGIAIGAGVGVALDNIPVGIGVGIALGVGFGSSKGKKNE